MIIGYARAYKDEQNLMHKSPRIRAAHNARANRHHIK
jgi:hypothetical protein